MKKCVRCGIEKSKQNFAKSSASKDGLVAYCKPCAIEYKAEWRARNFEKVKNSKLKHSFGITLEQYNKMYAKQEGKCAICQTEECETGKRFAVDHCHATGKIRGLLCSKCNQGIGLLGDTKEAIEKALKYLS